MVPAAIVILAAAVASFAIFLNFASDVKRRLEKLEAYTRDIRSDLDEARATVADAIIARHDRKGGGVK